MKNQMTSDDELDELSVQTIETYRYTGKGELTPSLLFKLVTTRDERNNEITVQRVQEALPFIRTMSDDSKEELFKELLYLPHGMHTEIGRLIMDTYQEVSVPLSMFFLCLFTREKRVCGLGCDTFAYAKLAYALSKQVDVKMMGRYTVYSLVKRGGCTDSWYWTRGDRHSKSEFIPYKILLELLDRREERILFDVYSFYKALGESNKYYVKNIAHNLRFNLGYNAFDIGGRLRSQLKKVLNHPKMGLVCASSYPKWDYSYSGNYDAFFKIVEMFPVDTQKIILQDEFISCQDQERRATLYEYCYGNAQLRGIIKPSYLKKQVQDQLAASREAQLLQKLQPEWITMQ